MYCGKCGKKNKDEDLYCSKCGNRLDEVMGKKVDSIKGKTNLRVVLKILTAITICIVIGAAIFLFTKFKNAQFTTLANINNSAIATINEPQNIQGNVSGNINHGGIATIQGDWIYFQKIINYKAFSTYKMKIDGSQKIELEKNSTGFGSLNVVGNWIYYLGQKGIYRMRTDGSQKTQLLRIDMDIKRFYVVGDWIYYQVDNSPKGNIIYKMKIDGSEKTELVTDDSGMGGTVVGDWVYFGKLINDGSQGCIMCKMRTDGSQKTELALINDSDITGPLEINALDINVVDDWIYYQVRCSNPKEVTIIYKMKTDGSQKTKLLTSEGHSEYLNVVGDWAYYQIENSKHQKGTIIYKIKTDGSQKKEVATIDISFEDLNIAGDWIYYTDGKNTYKMKTDGSQKGEA